MTKGEGRGGEGRGREGREGRGGEGREGEGEIGREGRDGGGVVDSASALCAEAMQHSTLPSRCWTTTQ